MKHLVIAIFFFSTLNLLSQNTLFQYSSNNECKFELIFKGNCTYQIFLPEYDSLADNESCFLRFMNETAKKPNGRIEIYDGQGHLRRVSHYCNELRQSNDTFLYANGRIHHLNYWRNDTVIKCLLYYPNGTLAFDYNDSTQTTTEWYENGQLKSVNNNFTGESKSWYKNGKLSLEGSDFPGPACSRIGVWVYYAESGEITKKLYYKDGSWYKGENDWIKKEIFDNGKIITTESK